MKFSYQWLSEWLPIEASADQLSDQLTSAGLEVDGVDELGAGLDGVVVGEIIDCHAHPDADRLNVCTVSIDQETPLQIVCGAPNARAGLKAPLATVGATLPGGFKIKPATLRGVESFGMLCSAPELGLGDDRDGLLELPSASSVGAALVQALNLPDWVIELDLTPNRADCLSMLGIAHELAAIQGVRLTPPQIPTAKVEHSRSIGIALKDAEACPRYVGRVITGIDTSASSPAWMVQKLERCGVRSLGPVVDATNYVLLELGQPMHAFDLDCIRGDLQVRRARDGETLVLLDGSEAQLTDDMLLIADDEQALALAGIMGGQASAVATHTSDILLESAWFNPSIISGRARRLGLSTDSSHRFERGVDPSLQVQAIERATQLIIDIAGGQAGPIVDCKNHDHLPGQISIVLRPQRVNQVLGTDLDASSIGELLRRLGMHVEPNDAGFSVQPPLRRRDLTLEVDLIEEVARMIGYDALPARRPGGSLKSQISSERLVSDRLLRDTLQARGFQEIMTWSFVSRRDLERCGMADQAQDLANPLSNEMGVLRTQLMPGLVQTASNNLRHQLSRLRLYETGRAFNQGDHASEQQRL
ncbi:MAG: phenylalanine--tRNA ligase subunit beta, partial [Pseudomonadota bacterium]